MYIVCVYFPFVIYHVSRSIKITLKNTEKKHLMLTSMKMGQPEKMLMFHEYHLNNVSETSKKLVILTIK